MANIDESLNSLMGLNGAAAVALVDYNSGMLLGSAGGGVDLEIAAAGNTEVVRAKMKTIKMLKLNQEIDDILITLSSQFHLIRPLHTDRDLFVYYVLDSSSANLALARRALKEVESSIQV
ncbi:MAG: hypothetical protein K6L60_02850 [Oceanobacter sp.]